MPRQSTPAVVRSKAWVCARSLAGIVGSNPAGGMDVCRECRVLSGRLDWSVYTCLTQLYDGRDMYNLLHREQLHVSALFIGHLQVDK